jgi:uncharacterized protein (TIGR02246 family)
MKRYLILLPVLMVALTGCPKKADVEAERTALRQADADWAKTVAEKNVDGFVSYFTPDGVVMAPNMPAANGVDAIRTWVSTNMSMPGFAVTWEATSAEVAASGDIGYTVGNFTYQMTMPDGTPLNDSGKYATIWKKQADGTWKVAVDVFNSENPMTPPASSDTTAVKAP